MKLIRKLLTRKHRSTSPMKEIIAISSFGNGYGAEIDLYYSTLFENRPYVIAMREVAADTLHSF
jgi:hypothetical protein